MAEPAITESDSTTGAKSDNVGVTSDTGAAASSNAAMPAGGLTHIVRVFAAGAGVSKPTPEEVQAVQKGELTSATKPPEPPAGLDVEAYTVGSDEKAFLTDHFDILRKNSYDKTRDLLHQAVSTWRALPEMLRAFLWACVPILLIFCAGPTLIALVNTLRQVGAQAKIAMLTAFALALCIGRVVLGV